MQEIKKEFGSLIKKLREDKGLSLVDVSVMTKIGAPAIGNWERGETLPTLMNAIIILKCFDCKLQITRRKKNE